MKLKKFLSALLVIAMVISLLPGITISVRAAELPTDYWTDTDNYSVPDYDSSTSTYTIDDDTELAWVAYTCNNDSSYSGFNGKNIVLSGNIDLSAHLWTPIGITNNFAGIFDGRGYTISGLTMSGSAGSYGGLFGDVAGATIENVGAEVSIETNVSLGFSGGLIGKAINSKITNCWSCGSLTVSANSGQEFGYAGGLIGYADRCTVERCYSKASVAGESQSEDMKSYAGGLIGSVGSGSIKNCYAAGAVSAQGLSTYAGGFAGETDTNNINYVYSAGTASNATYNGGFAGNYISSDAVDSVYYNDGNSNSDGEGNSAATSISASDMQNSGFATMLNVSQSSEPWKWISGVNNNYPVLDGVGDGDTGADIMLRAEAGSVWNGTISTSLSGSGTVADPFQISSGADLAYLAQQVNAGGTISYGSGSELAASSAYFKLTDDIVLNENASDYESWGTAAPSNSWTAIGTSSNKFTGTFDGDSHTVSGIYISNTGSDYQGLFGKIGGTVANLSIADSYIHGKDYVGAIAGCIAGGTVNNCYNKSSINGHNFVGGMSGKTDPGTVKYCVNEGSVNAWGGAGGIVGQNYGTVQYCFNTADVSVGVGGSSAGGVTSLAGGTITDCYNSGSIEGYRYVGGVAGAIYYAATTFTRCYSTGTVKATELAGGVAGTDSRGKTASCYYDKQMCTTGGIGGTDTSGAAGKLTSELAVSTAFSGWDSTVWNFTSDLYPMLTGYVDATADYHMDETDAAYVSASPISLAAADTMASVKSNFSVSTANGVGWASGNSGIVSINGSNATVTGSGNVILTASLNGITKAVALTASYTPTYSVSGTISLGNSTVTSAEGLTVKLYASTDTAFSTVLYAGTTDSNGNYTITGVPDGSYVAVIAGTSSNGRSVTGTITVNGANVTTGANIELTASHPDYTVTGGPAGLEVNGSGTYSTLADALVACTDDGDDDVLTIKLGSSGSPLQLTERNIGSSIDSSANSLIPATYYGSVEITDDANITGGVGLVIGNGASIFENVSVRSAAENSIGIFVKYNGNLTINGGTSTVCGNTSSCITSEAPLTINDGTFTASGTGSCCINNWDSDSGTGNLTINGGTFHVEGQDSVIINNAGRMSVTAGTFTAGNGTGKQGSCLKNTAAPSYGASLSGGSFLSGDIGGYGVYNTGDLAISGSAEIVAASGNTIYLSQNANTSLFGKMIHGSAEADIFIMGAPAGTGFQITSSGYPRASLIVRGLSSGKSFAAWTGDAAFANSISTINGDSVSNLTTGANAAVTDIYLKTGTATSVVLTAGSLGTAENGRITDLTAGKKYKVTMGSVVYYVKADRTLSISESDAAVLTGKYITGLTNGAVYYVEEYTSPLSVQPQGSGTQQDPYLIAAAGNLLWMSENVDDQNRFAGKYFKQTADIDMSGITGFVPIGNSAFEFSGTYDGDSYKISNLKIDYTITKFWGEGQCSENVGLFGTISGTVQNIILEDAVMNASVNGDKVLLNIGGIAGRLEGSFSVINCRVIDGSNGGSAINIDLNSTEESEISVGGIAGESSGSHGASLETVENQADIIVSCDETNGITGGSISTGGIVGYIGLAGINNALNSGIITVGGEAADGTYILIGGIAASSQSATIEHTLNVGSTVTSELVLTGSSVNTGGISGNSIASTVSENYYLASFADNGIAAVFNAGFENLGSSNSGVQPKTDSELKNAATFSAWDTVNVWTVADGAYPVLRASGSNTVTLASGSLGTAENGKITGLTSGTKYKVTVGSAVYYVKADGTLTANVPDAAALTGTEITGLTNGTAYLVEVYITGGGGSGGSGSHASAADTGAKIQVGGRTQDAGTVETKTKDGKTITAVTISTDKLKGILDSAGKGETVTIPIMTGSDTASGRLDGQAVRDMDNKEATLVIQTGSSTYTLPASEINIDAVSKQFGESISLVDIMVNVSIAQPSGSMVTVTENAAEDGGYKIAVPAVEFTVSCTYNGKTIELSTFNSYVERMIAIPDGVDPKKITTGIVVEPDGSIHHVPTEVVVTGGKYYAKINSLTNSVYSVIYNPVRFSDIENHWAKDAVNNMGSRLVVSGIGSNRYDPDRNITRAEFAAIMVKALGLEPGTGTNSFKDVDKSSWYCEYVKTASSYGIINGYSTDTFGPNDLITREQAMAMIYRTMKITGLKVSLTESEISELLSGYTDGANASNYAEESTAACLKSGIVAGTSETTISPKDYVTRAEVAVMAERLLQKSELI